MWKAFAFLAALSFTQFSFATDAIPAGYIKGISYRGGYVIFSIVGDDGSNYCSTCPQDPGGMGTQRCWVADNQKTEIAIILMASAQGKKIEGRVGGLSTDCGVYQLSTRD